jgi:hypothetical protein
MRTNRAAVAVLLIAGLATACGGSQAPQPAQSAPPATTAAAAPPAAPAGAAGDFGVPECDSFMNKWAACVDEKVPEAIRAQFRQSIEQTRTAWKQAAATPEGKSTLAAACSQMESTAKQSLAAYSCQW